MSEQNYSLEFIITNFKSYFEESVNFKIIKPLTIIAGPNGEGKSNLLEAMLMGMANFMNHSIKFKTESFFTKPIDISPKLPRTRKPLIKISLYDLIFTDIILKGYDEKSYSERLDPRNIVSKGKRKSNIQLKIIRRSNGRQRKLVEMTTTITRNEPFIEDSNYYNRIDKLELLYLNPDTSLNNLFLKLVGQEFSSQLTSILGTSRKAEYSSKILSFFSKEKDRLIRDIDDGKFEEKYLEGMNLFLTSNLATGAKKECILYILGLLKEKLKDIKDWVILFLIDEIESGLHISRQKIMIDALISTFQENEDLRKHVKIVMTTHSPIIYSELMKYPDYVDNYFILRNPGESSKIFKYDDIVDDEFKEKRILSELGLNIYEFPRTILFVEGKTDKEFWNEILENGGIHPLYGASIPNILSEILKNIPLARSKEYNVVVDESAYNKIKNDVQKLQNANVRINAHTIKYNSLEELIFDVKIDSEDTVDIWDKIVEKFEHFREKTYNSEKEILNINIEKSRKNLEPKGIDGIISLFNIFKNIDDFYKVLGKNWSILLEPDPKEIIKKIKFDVET